MIKSSNQVTNKNSNNSYGLLEFLGVSPTSKLRYDENDPPYLRSTFYDTISRLISLNSRLINENLFSIDFENSYFAINWNCI